MTLPAPLLSEARTRGGAPGPLDEARFELFYRRTAGSLWSYLSRLTGDPAAADDLVQKAFFRFLRASPSLASEDHMRRWVFRTATNLAFDHFREVKRDRARHDVVSSGPSSPTEAGEILRHDMMKLFGELKPQERALLWLAHVEGVDHEGIAEALHVKPKSVKVLLFRARKRLAELMTKRGLAPGVTR